MSESSVSRVAILASRSAQGCAEAEATLRARVVEAGMSVVETDAANLDGDLSGDADVLVLLGGDGFLMETLASLDYPAVPIFGVNFGTVGFHMNPQSSLDQLPRLLRGENDDGTGYRVDRHPVISVRAELEDGSEETLYLFNDLLLERQTPQSVRLRVWLDGTLFNRFAGDGFVVATAAGSTAYNLSAGGPAVHPGLDALVLTPLYPHQAVPFDSVRFSTAVPLSSRFLFRAYDLPKRGMRVVADGRPLDRVSTAEVYDSGKRITLWRVPSRGFAETLSKKIIGE